VPVSAGVFVDGDFAGHYGVPVDAARAAPATYPEYVKTPDAPEAAEATK
jgi:hypothetical protein